MKPLALAAAAGAALALTARIARPAPLVVCPRFAASSGGGCVPIERLERAWREQRDFGAGRELARELERRGEREKALAVVRELMESGDDTVRFERGESWRETRVAELEADFPIADPEMRAFHASSGVRLRWPDAWWGPDELGFVPAEGAAPFFAAAVAEGLTQSGQAAQNLLERARNAIRRWAAGRDPDQWEDGRRIDTEWESLRDSLRNLYAVPVTRALMTEIMAAREESAPPYRYGLRPLVLAEYERHGGAREELERQGRLFTAWSTTQRPPKMAVSIFWMEELLQSEFADVDVLLSSSGAVLWNMPIRIHVPARPSPSAWRPIEDLARTYGWGELELAARPVGTPGREDQISISRSDP